MAEGDDVVVPGTHESSAAVETLLLARWNSQVEQAASKRAAACPTAAVDAQDLAQEARAQLIRIMRASPDAPDWYIGGGIANAMRTALRRERQWLRVDSLFGAEEARTGSLAPEGRQDASMTVAVLARWVAGLPGRLQQLYRCLYMQGLTQRETAMALGVTQPRVAQLHRQLLDLGRAELVGLAA